ncbi:MAG: amino acid ABC transporter permease [Bacillota bacterium]
MIKGYRMNWGAALQFMPLLLQGVVATLKISALSILLAIPIGIILAFMRISKNKVANAISTAYIEFVRGIPLLVLLMFIYFGLGGFVNFSAMVAAVSGLGIFAGAFVAEIVRAGIESIPRGQMEAARASGMTYLQAMSLVIIPQAMKRIIPPLTGQFISLVKDSSLVMTISVNDLTMQTRNAVVVTFRSLELWSITAVLYFVMTFGLSRLLRVLERRFRSE